MTQPEISRETHFSLSSVNSWDIVVGDHHVGTLTHEDGLFEVYFWIGRAPYIDISVDTLQAISDERKRLLRTDFPNPSFWLTFKESMDQHARDIVKEKQILGSLQWKDWPRAVLYGQKDEDTSVRITVDDIDQILREYHNIISL